MNGNILFIIFLVVDIAILGSIYIFVNLSCKPAKNKKMSIKLNVGDVLLSKYISKNPFDDPENKHETVTEVRQNDDGDIYFLSYTSDENGARALEQNQLCAKAYGRRYWPEDWKVVNHIEIK